jgi:catechol 2,3-dioxygenase
VNRLIAHLAHVEVLTPKPEDSLRFYAKVLGLEESGREGRSIYMRGWGEWSFHSLQLTEAEDAGVGHTAWRAVSPEALTEAVRRLEAAGAGEGWVEDSVGHGPAYRYRGPGGHLHEIFWEIERYSAPEEERSPFPNRPQRFRPRGVAPRQIDHVTLMTTNPKADAEWYAATLGSTFTEWTTMPGGDEPVFATVTNCEKSHDLGFVKERSGTPGRAHHLAYWVDTRDELLRAADTFLNEDVAIEFGPGRHGVGEQDYLYVREPGGMRIEVNTGGYRLYEPDWEPVRWRPEQGSNVFYKNLPYQPSMAEGFPHVDLSDAAKEDAARVYTAPGVR